MASGRNAVIASNVIANPTNAGAKNSKKIGSDDSIRSGNR
jgi:hypothetical protein